MSALFTAWLDHCNIDTFYFFELGFCNLILFSFPIPLLYVPPVSVSLYFITNFIYSPSAFSALRCKCCKGRLQFQMSWPCLRRSLQWICQLWTSRLPISPISNPLQTYLMNLLLPWPTRRRMCCTRPHKSNSRTVFSTIIATMITPQSLFPPSEGVKIMCRVPVGDQS